MTSSRRILTLTSAIAAIACLGGPMATAQAPDPRATAPAESPPPFAAYKPGDVRVYMSPALRVAMAKVQAQAEAAIGRRLVIEMSQAALLQKGIEDGQPFEVALLTKPVMDAVVAKNRVTPASQLKLGEAALGLAARGDLGKVDPKTSAGLKKTILGAKTVRRNFGVGASVVLVDHMVKTLAVEEAIKPKIIAMVGAVGPPVPLQPLAPGEYELMFNMVSEVLDMPGWTFISAIPHDLRLPTEYAAGIGPLGDKAGAEALMRFLKSPTFRQALVDTGLEPAI